MRGLENLVGAVLAVSMIASLAAVMLATISRLVYISMHVLDLEAEHAIPPPMKLEELSPVCSNGVLPVELEVPGVRDFNATLFDLTGKVVETARSVDGAAMLRIPCNESVVITVSTRSGGFWVYHYELDPGRRCLAGYIVNASSILRGCGSDNMGPGNLGGVLQPVWVRSVLIGSRDAVSLLAVYGPVPGLSINGSETTYTVLGRGDRYVVRFSPAPTARAAMWSAIRAETVYDVFCKPLAGCFSVKRVVNGREVTDSDLTTYSWLEYEDAELRIARPGWIYIRDFRAIWPQTIQFQREFGSMLDREVELFFIANITPPFLLAKVYKRDTRLSDGSTSYSYVDRPLDNIYSAPVDILLVPLVVEKNQPPLRLSFAVLPVNYSIKASLKQCSHSIVTNSTYCNTKWSSSSASGPLYIGLYAYLVPLPEWRPGIPVYHGFLQLSSSRDVVAALARLVLLNLTEVSRPHVVGGVFSIDVGRLFDEANLVDSHAVLVLEVVVFSKGSRVILSMSDNKWFNHTGVVQLNGVNAYIHLSLLPANAYASVDSELLLAPGEKPLGYNGPGSHVMELEEPHSIGTSIALIRHENILIYDNESFEASPLPVACSDCIVLDVGSGIWSIGDQGSVVIIGGEGVNLESCVSAETILERFIELGEDALAVR